jgi:ABC-2 type transport system ATP-binding protein
VLTTPYPAAAPEMLAGQLGEGASVTPIDAHSLLVSGPAGASTLAIVSAWCVEHDVVPDSLVMGQRTLEDVFLQITGREME